MYNNPIPFYLQEYDPQILEELKFENIIDFKEGTFRFTIIFVDPTDDGPEHGYDETGIVKRIATLTGTFLWSPGMKPEEAECEDDIYPEIEKISFNGIDVSEEIWIDVHEEIDSCLCEYLNIDKNVDEYLALKQQNGKK